MISVSWGEGCSQIINKERKDGQRCSTVGHLVLAGYIAHSDGLHLDVADGRIESTSKCNITNNVCKTL